MVGLCWRTLGSKSALFLGSSVSSPGTLRPLCCLSCAPAQVPVKPHSDGIACLYVISISNWAKEASDEVATLRAGDTKMSGQHQKDLYFASVISIRKWEKSPTLMGNREKDRAQGQVWPSLVLPLECLNTPSVATGAMLPCHKYHYDCSIVLCSPLPGSSSLLL